MTWEEIGYMDGMKRAQNSLSTQFYPKRDKCSAEDETDYIRGYNQALADDKMRKEAIF